MSSSLAALRVERTKALKRVREIDEAIAAEERKLGPALKKPKLSPLEARKRALYVELDCKTLAESSSPLGAVFHEIEHQLSPVCRDITKLSVIEADRRFIYCFKGKWRVYWSLREDGKSAHTLVAKARSDDPEAFDATGCGSTESVSHKQTLVFLDKPEWAKLACALTMHYVKE